MAKTDCCLQQPKSGKSDEKREKRLKYLDFVAVAALHALMVAAKLYAFAKERSGPFKPGFTIAEISVSSVFGPLYSKSHHLLIQLLAFADRKVDMSVNKVQDCLPTTLKSASFHAYKHARSAPVAARSVMIDVKNAGMVETASGLAKTFFTKYEPVAKDFYTKYEPVTEEYVLYAWHILNQYILFQQVARAAAPIAGYCSEMYNQKVELAAKSGYKVASHLPLIPIEKIAEALRTENEKGMVIDGGPGEEVAAA